MSSPCYLSYRYAVLNYSSIATIYRAFPNFKAVRLYLEKTSGEYINRAYSVDRAPLNPACRFALKANENMGFRSPASTDENLRCCCR